MADLFIQGLVLCLLDSEISTVASVGLPVVALQHVAAAISVSSRDSVSC